MNILKSNEIYEFLKNFNSADNLAKCAEDIISFLLADGAEFAWILVMDFSTNKPLIKNFSSNLLKKRAEIFNKIVEDYFQQSIDSDEALEFINSVDYVEPIILNGNLCGIIGAFGGGNLKIITELVSSKLEVFWVKNRSEIEFQNRLKFLASVSHEFKTPLNSIIGFSEILLMKNCDKDLSRYINNIRNASQQLLTLIKDVLDLSRSQTNEMELYFEKFCSKKVILDALNTLNCQISDKKIIVEYTLTDAIIMADLNRFKQIILNLLSNAIKFNKISGKISILSYIDRQKNFVCEVKDTGDGISKDDYDKVFNFFSQVNNDNLKRQNGSGIGLYLCKKIVEAHGGEIGFKSRLNHGSTFWFNLPYKRDL